MSDTKCRRCSECEGMRHHWLDWLDDPAFGDDDAMNDDATECDDAAAEYACKHCPAVGKECERCSGDGCDPDGVDPDYPDPCPACEGEGVIEIKEAPPP